MKLKTTKQKDIATTKIQKFQYFETQSKPLTPKEDGIQEKPKNPLSSDILKRKKRNTNSKRKIRENNTLRNKPDVVEQLESLNINNQGNHHQDQLHPQTKVKKNH